MGDIPNRNLQYVTLSFTTIVIYIRIVRFIAHQGQRSFIVIGSANREGSTITQSLKIYTKMELFGVPRRKMAQNGGTYVDIIRELNVWL